jgi:hypothetical protein
MSLVGGSSTFRRRKKVVSRIGVDIGSSGVRPRLPTWDGVHSIEKAAQVNDAARWFGSVV